MGKRENMHLFITIGRDKTFPEILRYLHDAENLSKKDAVVTYMSSTRKFVCIRHEEGPEWTTSEKKMKRFYSSFRNISTISSDPIVPTRDGHKRDLSKHRDIIYTLKRLLEEIDRISPVMHKMLMRF
jgi:hypothetical protein